jgi:hypothetical protein
MKNFKKLYVEYQGLKGGCASGNNGTLGKSISIVNKTLFPNYIIDLAILIPDRKLDPIFRRDISQDEVHLLLPPPTVYYSIDQAIYQDTNGKKVLAISMDTWNNNDTTSNLFYFVHNSDGYITILDATKLHKVGFVKQTLSGGLMLKNQYFGVLYAVAKIINETTQKKEDIFTIIQFFVNVDDAGIVQNISMGYALPITEDAYSNQVTRTSFTATTTNWVGSDFQKSVDESFTNPFIVDVTYNPSVNLCAQPCSALPK